MHAANELNVIVEQLFENGRNNLGVILQAAPGHNLPTYHAGAHIQLTTPVGINRCYSLCRAYRHDQGYELCIKQDANSRGGSRSMHQDLKIGQHLTISTPRNAFALPDADYYILMAGGIGITPLLAMAEELLEKPCNFELHYYMTAADDMAFSTIWQQTELQSRVHIHISSAGNSLRDNLPDRLKQADAKTVIMGCGPEGFLKYIAEQLPTYGWQPQQWITEYFQAPVAEVGSQEKGFEVELNSSRVCYLVPPQKSIAQVLQEHGIAVELSCEQGMCGACVTGLLSGEADHRDMVLSPDERKSSIAICCSRAHSDHLLLNL